jgi:hypothetical protein
MPLPVLPMSCAAFSLDGRQAGFGIQVEYGKGVPLE